MVVEEILYDFEGKSDSIHVKPEDLVFVTLGYAATFLLVFLRNLLKLPTGA